MLLTKPPVGMKEQQSSAARAFFLANKDLFQYEKYVGNQDPFRDEVAHDQRDGAAANTFLEQYRKIDHDQPGVAPLSELHFSLLHLPTRKYSLANPTSSTTTPSPAFVALQSTASILKNSNKQREQICSHAFAPPPQSINCHMQTHSGYLASMYNTAPSSPDRVSVSIITANKFDQLKPCQQQHSPVRLSVESKQKPFRLPKLVDLLIDRENRTAATAHKTWDEAHKIEVLVGSKCVGRVSAASRNIPQSIRLRLRASANVSVRRERLYDLLRQDYEEISKHCTQ